MENYETYFQHNLRISSVSFETIGTFVTGSVNNQLHIVTQELDQKKLQTMHQSDHNWLKANRL